VTAYVVSVSENPRIPVGTSIGIPGRARIWIGATQKPDGSMGDLTAIRGDLLCPHCWRAAELVKFSDHECPHAPARHPVKPENPDLVPHPDQLDMLALLEGPTS